MGIIVFAVKKSPPEWEDYTTYQLWKINDNLGSWDWVNERWVGADENIDLSPIGGWEKDWRADSIRITHTVNEPLPDLRLYDTQDNLIASYDAIPRVDPPIIPITWQGYDIGRLVIIENGTTTIRVKPIEFLTNSTPYESPYLYEWSETLKSPDLTINPLNPLHAYKGASVGNEPRTILCEQGYSSGKFYFEIRFHANQIALTNCSMGIRKEEGDGGTPDYEGSVGGTAGRGYGYISQGRFYANGALLTSDPASWGTSYRWFTLGCAVNFSLGYLWFSLNGVWQSVAGQNPDPTTNTDPAVTGVVGSYFPAGSLYYESATYLSEMYFQGTAEKLEYGPPTGFLPWDPAI